MDKDQMPSKERTSPTKRQQEREKTRKLTITAMFSAITLLLSVTPLGLIPIGIFSFTTIHIPVIIAGVTEGVLVGAVVGSVFGFYSWFKHLTQPTLISFLFINPLISVVPRILIGVLSALFYQWIAKRLKHKKISYFITGVFGTFVNTFFVLGIAYLLYADVITQKMNAPQGAAKYLLGIAVTNGLPEMILSGVILVAVLSALEKIKK